MIAVTGFLVRIGVRALRNYPVERRVFDPRRASQSSTPSSPSAPAGRLLPRAGARQESLNRLLHLLANDFANPCHETLPARHETVASGGGGGVRCDMSPSVRGGGRRCIRAPRAGV